MTTHSSTLAWKIPWMEEPGRLQSMGLLRLGHDWVTSLSLSCIGEGYGNPPSVLAWRIPGMAEPGGLPSVRLYRVRHDWSNLAAAATFSIIHQITFPTHCSTKNDFWCLMKSSKIKILQNHWNFFYYYYHGEY